MVRYVVATGEKTVIGSYQPSGTATTTAPPTPSVSKTEGGQTMTVAEFLKMPELQERDGLGDCYSETAPLIIMQVKNHSICGF